jgi:hypothetical protein
MKVYKITLPLFPNTTPSFLRIASLLFPWRPLYLPIVPSLFTTRWHGIFLSWFFAMIEPTARDAFGLPARAATWEYVRTLPAGITETIARTFVWNEDTGEVLIPTPAILNPKQACTYLCTCLWTNPTVCGHPIKL